MTDKQKKKKKLTDRRIQKKRNEFFTHAITVAGLGFYSAKKKNYTKHARPRTLRDLKNNQKFAPSDVFIRS